MIRIECSCGKFLKVGEALVGKKIKCPACSAVQLVKQPAAAAVAARPKSSPVLEEGVSPAPKKKSALANGAPKSPVPAKRRIHDDDDDDDRPRKKQPAKKGGNGMLLLLVGGGAAALVLLMGVAVAGYFLFIHNSTPEPIAKKTEDGPKAPAAKSDPVAIKLFVPYKKGDKREISVVSVFKENKKILDESKLPQKSKELAAKNSEDQRRSTLRATVTTLEVDAKGEETKFEVVAQLVKLENLVSKEKPEEPFKAGTAAIGTRGKDGYHQWSEQSFGQLCGEIYFNQRGDWPESDADDLFGTLEQQVAGNTWEINKSKVVEMLKQKFSPDPGNEVKDFAGTGRLVSVSSENDKPHLEVAINYNLAFKEKEVSGTLKSTFNVRLPQDGKTGPLKTIVKQDIAVQGDFKFDESGTKVPVKVTINQTTTIETKYLGNFPVNNSTGSPVDSPKTADILKAELQGATAEWVPNQSKVKYSVNYKALANTKPNGRADYTLYLQFDDGEGGKKIIPVDEPLDGTTLGASRPYSNPSLTVTLPPKGNPAVCYLVLMEKIPGNVKEREVCSVRVSITGTPPTTSPTPAPEKLDIKLTNAKLQFAGKTGLNFSVDYKVTAGKVDPNKNYRVFVLLDGNKVKKGAINAHEVQGSKLQSPQGTLSKDFTGEAGADAKFTLWIVELPPGAKTGETVSNIIPGSVGGLAPPGPAPYFQVNIATAQKVKNPSNPKAQAQAFTLQFTWNLTKGEINNQAAYTVYIVANGVKSPLGPAIPGKTFPASSTYNNTLPLPKVNNFQIHIEEQVQGQASRVVSTNPTHNIK